MIGTDTRQARVIADTRQVPSANQFLRLHGEFRRAGHDNDAAWALIAMQVGRLPEIPEHLHPHAWTEHRLSMGGWVFHLSIRHDADEWRWQVTSEDGSESFWGHGATKAEALARMHVSWLRLLGLRLGVDIAAGVAR